MIELHPAGRPEVAPSRPSRPTAGAPGRHIPALDGVRGLAILLVLLGHLGSELNERGGTAIGPALDAIVRHAWLGVDLFFVLSGFLITGILLDTKASPRYFRNFYMRRALRIFPVYYGVLVVVFLIAPRFQGSGGIAGSVGRDQGWFWLYGVNILAAIRGGMFPLSHFWSLAVEEHFYLAWPLVVFACSRRSLMAACAGVAVVALATRAWMAPRFGPIALYCLTPCRMDTLAIGGLMAAAVRGPGGAGGSLRALRPLLMAALAGLAGLAAWKHGLPQFDGAVQVAGYSLLAVAFGGLVTMAATGPRGGPLGRVLDNALLRTLGKYSYGIYVYHVFVMSLYAKHVPVGCLAARLGSYSLACLVYLGSASALALLLAWVSWYVYERPFLTLKRYFAHEGRAEAR